jgi:hypothetical protein
MIFIANLLTSQSFLNSFCFCRSSILICSANVNCVKSSKFAVASFFLKFLWSLKKYREYTSALSVDPTIFPKCGTLLTYGSAEVIRIFLFPFTGKIGFLWYFTVSTSLLFLLLPVSISLVPEKLGKLSENYPRRQGKKQRRYSSLEDLRPCQRPLPHEIVRIVKAFIISRFEL